MSDALEDRNVWLRALEDVVSRTGGKPLASKLLDAASFADLTGDLPAAAGSSDQRQ